MDPRLSLGGGAILVVLLILVVVARAARRDRREGKTDAAAVWLGADIPDDRTKGGHAPQRDDPAAVDDGDADGDGGGDGGGRRGGRRRLSRQRAASRCAIQSCAGSFWKRHLRSGPAITLR